MQRLIRQLEEAARGAADGPTMAEGQQDRPVKHGPMLDYDWKAVAKALGAQIEGIPKRGKDSPVKLRWQGVEYQLYDNGGEINIVRVQRVGESVPFWSNAHSGGAVGPKTLAYRLAAEITGDPLDYDRDDDKE